MNRLVCDLVDVASIDAGKLTIAPTCGDTAVLIAEAVDTFHDAARVKGLSLRAEIAQRPLLAEFDHGRLLQVLANLIANAIKFTAPEGRIAVRGEQDGPIVRFSIHDTGTGIPTHLLGAIFERFWQVGQTDRRGLGLGLYISRCIVEAHGGQIWAESTEGRGSTIWFTLPEATDRRRGEQ